MTVKIVLWKLNIVWQQKGVEPGNDFSNTYSKPVINWFTAKIINAYYRQ